MTAPVLTNLLFSWLNELLSTWPFSMVMLLVYVVGIGMFMLPPVPGVPVYFADGIIVVQAAQSFMGYVGACVFMCVVGLSIKLIAVALQQKAIGEQMGHSVAIRQAVGVNSVTIKAIRLILAQPGLTVDKVCVLVGGPDWPI